MNKGFSLIELLVGIAIMGVSSAVSFPYVANMLGQMRASEDIRQLAYTLSELRAEAIRLKTNVRISFSETGYSWDIGDDSVIDGSLTLNQYSEWKDEIIPGDIVFNGLGIARGIGSEVDIELENKNSLIALTINANGHMNL